MRGYLLHRVNRKIYMNPDQTVLLILKRNASNKGNEKQPLNKRTAKNWTPENLPGYYKIKNFRYPCNKIFFRNITLHAKYRTLRGAHNFFVVVLRVSPGDVTRCPPSTRVVPSKCAGQPAFWRRICTCTTVMCSPAHISLNIWEYKSSLSSSDFKWHQVSLKSKQLSDLIKDVMM